MTPLPPLPANTPTFTAPHHPPTTHVPGCTQPSPRRGHMASTPRNYDHTHASTLNSTNTNQHTHTRSYHRNHGQPTTTNKNTNKNTTSFMRTGSQRKMKATYMRSKKKYYYCTLDCRRSQCYPIFYHVLVGLSLSVRLQCTWFSLSKNVFCPCPRH